MREADTRSAAAMYAKAYNHSQAENEELRSRLAAAEERDGEYELAIKRIAEFRKLLAWLWEWAGDGIEYARENNKSSYFFDRERFEANYQRIKALLDDRDDSE